MPTYSGKQIFSLGNFPEVGQKQKTERKKRDKKLVLTMDGQLCIAKATWSGTRKAAWAKILKGKMTTF